MPLIRAVDGTSPADPRKHRIVCRIAQERPHRSARNFRGASNALPAVGSPVLSEPSACFAALAMPARCRRDFRREAHVSHRLIRLSGMILPIVPELTVQRACAGETLLKTIARHRAATTITSQSRVLRPADARAFNSARRRCAGRCLLYSEGPITPALSISGVSEKAPDMSILESSIGRLPNVFERKSA